MVDPYIYYSSFSTEYKAVLNKAVELGYLLPSVNQQRLQDQFMRSLIAINVFAKADLFYLLTNDAGLDFARINWKNPSAFLLTNNAGNPVYYLRNYGPYVDTSQTGYLAGLLPGWSPGTLGSANFSLASNSALHSTKSGYGTSGFAYRTTGPGGVADAYMYYSIDTVRTAYNNAQSLTSAAAVSNFTIWMNRRTVSGSFNLYNVDAGAVTLALNYAVAAVNRTTAPLGIICDMGNASSASSLGHPMEVFFIGGALTDTEALNFEVALDTYLDALRYVTVLFTSGNYTVPAGMTELLVECWGAGGAGRGYPNATQAQTGSGGGGGAYAASLLTVTPGAIIPFVIAPVTPGNATAGTPGATGGDTSWNGGQILAKGGTGGQGTVGFNSPGGQASSSVGDIKYNGGAGGAMGSVLNASTGSGGSAAGALGAGPQGVNGATGVATITRPPIAVLGGGAPGYSQSNAANLGGIGGMLAAGGGGARRTTLSRVGGPGGQGFIRISAPRIY